MRKWSFLHLQVQCPRTPVSALLVGHLAAPEVVNLTDAKLINQPQRFYPLDYNGGKSSRASSEFYLNSYSNNFFFLTSLFYMLSKWKLRATKQRITKRIHCVASKGILPFQSTSGDS
ncbi:hypothetical protein AMECASPLE_005364 [Ameca splendens]|uniref:Uncharacterized protein n=1 Tax=Ameca splendens TaxID=208324 RepID=A0ABV0XN75_9TELE